MQILLIILNIFFYNNLKTKVSVIVIFIVF